MLDKSTSIIKKTYQRKNTKDRFRKEIRTEAPKRQEIEKEMSRKIGWRRKTDTMVDKNYFPRINNIEEKIAKGRGMMFGYNEPKVSSLRGGNHSPLTSTKY